MIKNIFAGIVLGGMLSIIFAACTSNTISGPNPTPSSSSAPSNGPYKQLELLSRPAVKEAFENFNDHDTTNRTEPYNDPTLQGEIGTFTTTVAGRSAANASTLQAVLYPNEMIADLSQNVPNAAYLGVETAGATGSAFGGRALRDDVIDISLGAIFGNTLSALGLIPDDGKESPCLTTDNVSYASVTSTTFPYTQAPI